MLRRKLADHGTRERRPDLLIRIADVRDRPEPFEPRLLKHVHGEEAREQTALHVGHARPASDVAFDAEGALRHGSLIEDGVHVADEHDVGASGTAEPPDH